MILRAPKLYLKIQNFLTASIILSQLVKSLIHKSYGKLNVAKIINQPAY